MRIGITRARGKVEFKIEHYQEYETITSRENTISMSITSDFTSASIKATELANGRTSDTILTIGVPLVHLSTLFGIDTATRDLISMIPPYKKPYEEDFES